jgi:hypothetical protein
VIQDLAEKPFPRKKVAQKNKMIKDWWPYTPLPNAKVEARSMGEGIVF